jgi:hypothetical protein
MVSTHVMVYVFFFFLKLSILLFSIFCFFGFSGKIIGGEEGRNGRRGRAKRWGRYLAHDP